MARGYEPDSLHKMPWVHYANLCGPLQVMEFGGKEITDNPSRSLWFSLSLGVKFRSLWEPTGRGRKRLNATGRWSVLRTGWSERRLLLRAQARGHLSVLDRDTSRSTDVEGGEHVVWGEGKNSRGQTGWRKL